MLAAAGVIFEELFGPAPGLEFCAANGRSQMDVFWDFWDKYPNVIAASIVLITVIEVPSGIAATAGRKTGQLARASWRGRGDERRPRITHTYTHTPLSRCASERSPRGRLGRSDRPFLPSTQQHA